MNQKRCKYPSKAVCAAICSVFWVFCVLALPIHSFAQQKMLVKGVVTDQKTREPIPFCNILLTTAKTGTISQIDGIFTLQLPLLPDTLLFSAVGYEKFRLPIIDRRENIFEIKLVPQDIELTEVIITPHENPANAIMRKVIEKRAANNPLRTNTLACNAYTKILANSIGESENKVLLKSGTPIFFSEKYTQNYLSNNPFIEKERVIDQRISGLGLFNELDILQVTNSTTIEANLYNSIVELFDKPFISPMNPRAFAYYRFYLRDSITTSYGKEYLIEFMPRNNNDPTFSGYMKVIDEMWALSEISAKVPVNANLNYINKMEIYQSFVPINDTLTFFLINETITELKLTKDNAAVDLDFSFIVDKRTLFSHVKINFPPVNTSDERVLWSDTTLYEPLPQVDQTIETIRPEVISAREEKALLIIDSLNNRWQVKTVDGLTRMFATGYIPGKKIDIGPYLNLLKYNKVEGLRMTLTGRTSENLIKNAMLYGHLGYGIRDREWKYGAGVKYKITPANSFRNYRRIATLEYRNDMSIIGNNRSIYLIKENMMVAGDDNVISALFTGKPLAKLSREISYRAEYEHEWRRGLISQISIDRREISSGLYFPFTQNNIPVNRLTTNEITLGTRLSWKESITDNYCRRYYMGTKYPIVNLRLTGGHYQVGNISDNYLSARIVVNHDINIGLTKFEYVFEGSYSLGKLPFPLLEGHRTDQSIGLSRYSFNMMNEMEFVSDRFLSVMADYHLNGLLFNRIPLLRKLGLREVFSTKALWSHLGEEHQQVLQYPAPLADARLPYAEVSAGVENILQYFRVDVVGRIAAPYDFRAVPLAVKFRFDFKF